MKTVSVLLVIAYLTLPALCPGRSFVPLLEHSAQSMCVSAVSAEYQLPHDAANCETTCCCDGHVPRAAGSAAPCVDVTVQLKAHEPYPALPRLIERIFVPPHKSV